MPKRKSSTTDVEIENKPPPTNNEVPNGVEPVAVSSEPKKKPIRRRKKKVTHGTVDWTIGMG